MEALLDAQVKDTKLRAMLKALSRLSGDVSVLEQANTVFADAASSVKQAVAELHQIAQRIAARLPDITLGFDLSELRGYQYHTGIVFAAYTPGYGRAVAKGGRYDDIGEVFGRARPASGFDADLKILALLSNNDYPRRSVILAPDSDDSALLDMVTALRTDGLTVVTHLGADSDAQIVDVTLLKELNCIRRIVRDGNGNWCIVELA
jgi:ATP phosphoribosyltransferase regulatory subunit